MTTKLTAEQIRNLKGPDLFDEAVASGIWKVGMKLEDARQALLSSVRPDWAKSADEDPKTLLQKLLGFPLRTVKEFREGLSNLEWEEVIASLALILIDNIFEKKVFVSQKQYDEDMAAVWKVLEAVEGKIEADASVDVADDEPAITRFQLAMMVLAKKAKDRGWDIKL